MKNVALFTAAALAAATAFTGAASAQPYNTGDFARAALVKIAPDADVASLSNAEAVAVYQSVQSETGNANQTARAEAMINGYN